MDGVTIGQISSILAFIVGIIASVEYLLIRLNKVFDKKMLPLNKQINSLDEATCKNYLVRFLKDKENGLPLDEVEVERAYEVYDHYTNDLHKNSYIHAKWEKLMK